MSFASSVESVLRQYATFTGRSMRSEFWWFLLFELLVVVALQAFDSVVFPQWTSWDWGGPTSWLFQLAILLPSLAVTVRRLHDTDRSGWWMLLALVPLIGAIVVLVFCAQDSQVGTNRFGPSPKNPIALGEPDDALVPRVG